MDWTLAAPLTCVFILSLVVVYGIVRSRPLETLPSVAWIFLVMVPFIYLSQYFPSVGAYSQAIGCSLVGLALAGGDVLGILLTKETTLLAAAAPTSENEAAKLSWTKGAASALKWALVSFVVIVPIFHLSVAPSAPLFHLLGMSATPLELSLERENFAKLLDLPEPVKLLFNWVIIIAGPLLTVLLAAQKRYAFSMLAALWCASYALLSLAKMPLILFIAFTLAGLLAVRTRRLGRWATVLGILLLAVTTTAGIYRGQEIMRWYEAADFSAVSADVLLPLQRNLATTDLPVSPGDVERMGLEQVDGLKWPVTFGATLDSVLYRSILGPVEVANRWYEYFPKIAGGWRSLEDLLPLPRKVGWLHASNLVGKWAYVQRFPNRYLESVHAYASLDADAYSFGGLIACLIAAMLVVLLRALLIVLRGTSVTSVTLYTFGVGYLAALPFQASLQAILIPQGLAGVIILLLAWRAFVDRFPNAFSVALVRRAKRRAT